ncbi:hypothetical protein M231_04161 [Tremella mesenterica]|uniref:SH3 domain-containing protein n=1 Tax=Tremella mesenterica TaxID=5217 RepID=A0A4Q1BL70_TREME|nr:hypothetical protein M231_04161 [Tremella mesenterica]
MIDYGETLGGGYGEALEKYGRARCKLAATQEEFGQRLSEGYIAGIEGALATVTEYKAMRKKLDSRRLALDSALNNLNKSKKDKHAMALEAEVENAQQRFSEIEEETQVRMKAIEENEEQQFMDLVDLLEAELEYFSKCRDILEDLKDQWPPDAGGRPRARSNASARSFTRTAARGFSSRPPANSDEDAVTPNRSRSQSNASSIGKGKEKRSMLPSFGSLGKKSGLSNVANVASMRKPFKSDKYGNLDEDERPSLQSEDDDNDSLDSYSRGANGRARSSTITSSRTIASDHQVPPPSMRRTQTTPANAQARYVKALFDFNGEAADELQIRTGQIIEVKSEVSSDWWIGECEGRSGLFPKAYTEEYVPSPQTAVPIRRTLPPPANLSRSIPQPPMATSPPDEYPDTESDVSHDLSDNDHHGTALLASGALPPPIKSSIKKPAPPPPPSRRSQSSTNLSTTLLAPPRPGFRSRSSTLSKQPQLSSSPEASPFAGSEDEEYLSTVGSGTGAGTAAPVMTRGLSHGLSSMHLANQKQDVSMGTCATCGCDEFTQNVFKAKGTCSTCFHQH